MADFSLLFEFGNFTPEIIEKRGVIFFIKALHDSFSSCSSERFLFWLNRWLSLSLLSQNLEKLPPKSPRRSSPVEPPTKLSSDQKNPANGSTDDLRYVGKKTSLAILI